MRLLNTLIILAVIIFLIITFAPNIADAAKEKIVNWVKPVSEQFNETINNTIMTNPRETTLEEQQEKVTPPINIEQGSSVCGGTNKGLTNYEGTNLEGNNCADSINGDNECISNPPINYDGEINSLLKTSNPTIRCCYEDGYCYW